MTNSLGSGVTSILLSGQLHNSDNTVDEDLTPICSRQDSNPSGGVSEALTNLTINGSLNPKIVEHN